MSLCFPKRICAEKVIKESRGYSLCFIFLAHLFNPAELETGIEERLKALDLRYRKVEADDLIGNSEPYLDGSDRLLIWLRRKVFESPNRCEQVGLLGEVATKVIRQERPIILLSEMPALDFVDCGPSGFIDEVNKNIVPSPLTMEEVHKVVSSSSTAADADELFYLSNGLPRLMEVIGSAAVRCRWKR